jgi:hypothetical protein
MLSSGFQNKLHKMAAQTSEKEVMVAKNLQKFRKPTS